MRRAVRWAMVPVLMVVGTARGASDAKAVEIAHAMMHAMGGEESWKNARFVRFDFITQIHGEELLRRGHLWDTRTGRCRTEDKTATGEPAVVLFNSGTRQGVAYANGEKMPEATSAKAIAGEYAVLLTDTYWLAMPWKWLDPGVNLKYMGRKKRGAHMYDVVELTFDHGVGPTSGDRYEAYVSPETHLMEHWDYVLENGTKGSWDWQYTTTHGMKLASNHTDAKDDAISMGDVRVLDSVDDAFFTDPGKNLAQLGK